KLRQEYPDFNAPRMLINHRPPPHSGTTLINIMNLFCTFLHWCNKMKYSDNEVYALYGCK
ncbi:integrase, partial [Alistipes putredinis]|nr:integrase [Alistipes putredinis]